MNMESVFRIAAKLTAFYIIFGICTKFTCQIEQICVPLERCPTVLNIVQKYEYSPEIMNFLRTYKCLYSQKAGFLIWCPQPSPIVHASTDDRIYYEERGKYILPKDFNNRAKTTNEAVKVENTPVGFIWGASDTKSEKNYELTTKKNDFKFPPSVEDSTRNVDLSDVEVIPFVNRNPKKMKETISKPQETGDSIYFPDEDDFVSNFARTARSNILNKLSASCGRPFYRSENSGNRVADLGEFPWMALLEYNRSGAIVPGCAGALISATHVVTAASCVDIGHVRERKLGQLFQIVLGEYDNSTERDCIKVPFGERCGDIPVKIGVKSVVLYGGSNDTAILQLEKDVEFSDFIQPICVPETEIKFGKKQDFLTASWQTQKDTGSYVLMKTKLERVGAKISPIKEPDYCTGFPGNPVMLQDLTKSDSPYYLMGIDLRGIKSNNCGGLET